MPVNDLASGALVGTMTTEQLYAGDAPVTTDSAVSTALFAKYEVAALLSTGLAKFVPGTHTADQAVITAQPITTIGQMTPYFKSGCFNHAILVWPVGTALDTYAERKAFFGNRALTVGKIS